MLKPLRDLRVAILFGGPSSERDISLDSARTFYDAVRFLIEPANILLLFVEQDLSFTRIDERWIYANTTDDFLLSREAEAVGGELRMPFAGALDRLRGMDGIFSFVHGTFGEDGEFERRLRAAGCAVPLLGSGGAALETLYDKAQTSAALQRLGFPVTPAVAVRRGDEADAAAADRFALDRARVVVKPARGGSSDGVSIASSADLEGALATAHAFSDVALVEQFIDGREFSVIVFQGLDGRAMPLLPTEIAVTDRGNPLYTRLKKYMPGSGAVHFNPARFPEPALHAIREQAACLFDGLGLEDWARFDGFLTPAGEVMWSDLNGVPGFGADSLLFQQSALFGFDQSSISYHLLARTLAKDGIAIEPFHRISAAARKVAVIGGGQTSERQVSRMSWLNVIQKLSYTRRNDVQPVFEAKDGQLYRVPTFATLQHTVEEIDDLIRHEEHYLGSLMLAAGIARAFDPAFASLARTQAEGRIAPVTLDELAEASDFVFLALHGGRGENGEYQAALDRAGTPYNGSGPAESALFMDKAATAAVLRATPLRGIRAPANMRVGLAALQAEHGPTLERFATLVRQGRSFVEIERQVDLAPLRAEIARVLAAWMDTLGSPRGLVFKPLADGCSSGVFIWHAPDEGAERFLLAALSGVEEVAWAFLGARYLTVPSEVRLKLPFAAPFELLVEELHASTEGDRVIELTAAVFGPKGQVRSLVPSQTLSEFDLLTLEEKFCKGVGVNVTPPADLPAAIVEDLRARIGLFANAMGIRGYARIDWMYYVDRDELVLIEVNSLPGLSMATVTFTQALVTPGITMAPSEFLEAIMQVGVASVTRRPMEEAAPA